MAAVVSWRKLLRDEVGTNPDNYSITNVYLAEFDEIPADPLLDVLNYGECPTFFKAHETSTNLFCVGIDPVQVPDAPQLFEIRITWAAKYNRDGLDLQFGDGVGELDNPLLIPAAISYSSYTTRKEFKMAYQERVVNTQADGSEAPSTTSGSDTNTVLNVPVITRAGEPIYLEDEVEYPIIRIQKNVTTVNPIFAKKRRFINTDTVRINNMPYEPDCLLLRNMQIGPFSVWKPTVLKGAVRVGYWPMSFELYYNPDTWYRKVYNAGYIALEKKVISVESGGSTGIPVYRYAENGKLVNITIGQPPHFPNSPVPLTRDGRIHPIFVNQKDDQPLPQDEFRKAWKEAELQYRTVERIRFTNLVPLK